MAPVTRLLTGILLLVVVLVGVAFALPQHISVARSTTVNAPESDIFPYLNELTKLAQWSPWASLDADTVYTFEGPEAGMGARMTWRSDHARVGSGSQEIVESRANDLVKARLDFGDMGEATSTYQLAPSSAGTRVTLAFDIDVGNDPLMRWVGLWFARTIGADFERGLGRLKSLAEANR